MKYKENFEVSIIGVGNIGFRYYQALLNIEYVSKVNLVEKNIEYLEQRLLINKNSKKQIHIYKEVSEELIKSDLIIVSTTSSERYLICSKLQEIGYYGDLILEKFLFPDQNTLIKSKTLFNSYPASIFVNQWMRITNLKNILKIRKPLNIEIVSDNLGLLCNSVHFIDLICGTYQSINFKIDLAESYIKRIIKSKRVGYMEICGKFVWRDNENLITFSLEDRVNGNNTDVFFNVSNKLFNNKYVYCDKELKNLNTGKTDYIPYLSEHSCETISSILNGKKPTIPKFEDSLIHHNLVFNALSKLLKKDDYELIKIT